MKDWIASWDEIAAGRVTDVYFSRTLKVLEAEGLRPRVRAEFTAGRLPEGWAWAVVAGTQEALELLARLPVTVRGVPEGTIVGPGDVVLEIEGVYPEFAVYETAVLGLLCQATGIATQAARCRLAAGDRTLVSFGARRMHPALAPVIERSAYIGGCDGVSTLAAADRLGIPATGTMPHALVLVVGDCVEATRAFHRAVGSGVPVVSLVDTFSDEKFEALRVADALGPDLAAVRLDTPGSRRGDFERIIREVRWELDLRGHRDVGIFVSGGLSEADLSRLRPWVQGFGVGTAISAARTVDFSMDIVEVDGRAVAKRGKCSGAKDLYGCAGCGARTGVPRGRPPGEPCPCGSRWELMTRELVRDGRWRFGPETVQAVRERVAAGLRGLSPGAP